jgi:hypothetical protein
MNRLLPVILAAALLTGSPTISDTSRNQAAPAGSIVQVVNLNPGAVAAQDCQARQVAEWDNDTGQVMRVVAVDSWMGLYRDASADITIEVYRTDGLLISRNAQDRYSNPDGPGERFVNFAPAYIDIAAGQGVLVRALNCHVAGPASPMAPTVVLYLSQ